MVMIPSMERNVAGKWAGEDKCAHLKVTIDYKAVVHVFQPQNDLCCIETHLILREDSMLRQVVMEVAPCREQSRAPYDAYSQLQKQGAKRQDPAAATVSFGEVHKEEEEMEKGFLQAEFWLSPFMRSRMKLSLSGVWKAYDMHTMKGQSWQRHEGKSHNRKRQN